MITLYHSPQTRSASIVWLLEELEVPYQTKLVDFDAWMAAVRAIPRIRILIARCRRWPTATMSFSKAAQLRCI